MSGPGSDRSVGGVVVRSPGGLRFVPATVALRVLPMPQRVRVPGAPASLLGVALVDGEAVPLVDFGAHGEALLLCTYHGEGLGLANVEVVATGRFEPDGADAVTVEGARVPYFDFPAIVEHVQSGRWAV
ncbi:MAG: hypothetical protein KC657_28770 [Myxococcales bacterium]|nr:hypothetical protein [Myxococcales bacterium]